MPLQRLGVLRGECGAWSGLTVSATDIVSFRSLSNVATSCTISRRAGGGKTEVDMSAAATATATCCLVNGIELHD